MTQWFLTGCSGYVGGRLLSRAKSLDVTIDGLFRNSFQVEGISSVIKGDLSCSPFPEFIKKGTSAVIHLAQSNFYREFPAHTADITSVNVNATTLLLDQAVRSNAESFIFASTANVYGSRPGFVAEEDSTSPDSYYAATKLAAEHLVQQYSRFINIYILRIYTVYGPNQPGKLFDNIYKRIIADIPISLVGNGLQLTPIYVEDLVDIILECSSGILPPGVYNVCGNDALDLREISSSIARICKKPLNIKQQLGEPHRYCGSNAKLISARNGIHLTPFEKGIYNLISQKT
jgi:nucleoside-diphosphate-sugar epimerase